MLQDHGLHVGDGVAGEVEMGSCRLAEVAASYITQMFFEPVIELSACLSNILNVFACRLCALYTINYIFVYTVEVSLYSHSRLTRRTFNKCCLYHEWTSLTVTCVTLSIPFLFCLVLVFSGSFDFTSKLFRDEFLACL